MTGTSRGLTALTSLVTCLGLLTAPATATLPAHAAAQALQFSLPLQAGWNLVSLPIHPADTAASAVLAPIAGSYDLVYAYDAAGGADPWRRYNPAVPAPLNDLSQLDEHMGFWIHTIAAVTLTVSGTAPTSTAVQLAPGWNLVGCPFQTSQPVATALASVAGHYDLVYTTGPGGDWLKYTADPATGDDFATMDPGKGYWVHATGICPTSSTLAYVAGPARQYDTGSPVRPAEEHPDKNLSLRGYVLNSDPSLKRELVSYGTDDPTQPPQLATLFSPYQVPRLVGFYRVYNWNWTTDSRGSLITSPRVTAMGLETTPGQALHVPTSGYDIGQGMEVLVIYADEDSITLKYTREDSAATGYMVHLDKICTDPNLLALYRMLDDPDGPRYVYRLPAEYWYDLPALAAGQVFGTAQGSEIVVAIRDTGSFMDPRSCGEWWQIRPGYTGTCPAHD